MLPVALLFVSACLTLKERDDVGDQEVTGEEAGRLIVSSNSLDFGALGVGESKTLSVSLESVGSVPVAIADVLLVGDDFTLAKSVRDVELYPDESTELAVVFSPVGGAERAGSLTVQTDTDEDPTVSLAGWGDAPGLVLDPPALDFGDAIVGCPEQPRVVAISNDGNEDLVVDAIETSGPDFAVTFAFDLPLTVAPGDAREVSVAFDPEHEGPRSASLEVSANVPGGSVSLIGTGTAVAEKSDHFEIEQAPVDILLFVDQSCSMDDNPIPVLQDAVQTMVDELDHDGLDWQISVVNNDDGCSLGTIFPPASAADVNVIKTAMATGGGLWTEAGLTVLEEALTVSGAGGCNEGFVRDGALLHGIMVSDEPEQSVGSWSDHVDAIWALKGSDELVKLSAIAGDYPSGCSTADPGAGYYDAALETGGEFLSICADDYGPYMAVLADASSTAGSVFSLRSVPDPATLEVLHDGVVISAWTYDAVANAVTVSVPLHSGDSIDISYTPVGACN